MTADDEQAVDDATVEDRSPELDVLIAVLLGE
jgi:hypothetical protein